MSRKSEPEHTSGDGESGRRPSLLLVLIGFSGAFLVVQSGVIEYVISAVVGSRTPSEATRYAEARIQVIKTSSDCGTFRDLAMDASKLRGGAVAVRGRIDQVIEAARLTGCIKES